MLTIALAMALAGQAAAPSPIAHPSGKRDGLVIAEKIACPLSGNFEIAMGSDDRRRAYVSSLTRHGQSFPKEVLEELDGWLSNVGYLEFLEVGCTDDAAIVLVHSTKIENGRGGSQVFAFVINEKSLVRTPK